MVEKVEQNDKAKNKHKQISRFKGKVDGLEYGKQTPLDKMSKGEKEEPIDRIDQKRSLDMEARESHIKEKEKYKRKNWQKEFFVESLQGEKEQGWQEKEVFFQEEGEKKRSKEQERKSYQQENSFQEESKREKDCLKGDKEKQSLIRQENVQFPFPEWGNSEESLFEKLSNSDQPENFSQRESDKNKEDLLVESSLEKFPLFLKANWKYQHRNRGQTLTYDIKNYSNKVERDFVNQSESQEKAESYVSGTEYKRKKQRIEDFVPAEKNATKEDAAFARKRTTFLEKEDSFKRKDSISTKEKAIFTKEDFVVSEKDSISTEEKISVIENPPIFTEDVFPLKKEDHSFYRREKRKEQEKKREKYFDSAEEKKAKPKEFLSAENTDATVSKSKKWNKRKEKAEKAEARLHQAEKKLPKQKDYHWEHIFDEESGTGKYVLKVVEQEKEWRNPLFLERTAKKLQNKSRDLIHNQVAEVEKENSGVEAAHKSELLAERTFDFVVESRLSKQQKQQKLVKKLEKKKRKADALFLYQDYLEEHPELPKKVLQKQIQKKRIKREYAKAYRQEQMIKQGKEIEEKVTSFPKMAKKIEEKAKKSAIFIGVGGSLLFLVFTILIGVSFGGTLFGEIVSMVLTGSYLSEPEEIDKLELNFTKMETDLQDRIDQIEWEYPDYEEYHYELEEIRHDPFTLISYFSARYSEFTASERNYELEALFQESYQFTLTPKIEIRTKIETETRTDPITGVEWEEEVEVAYEVRILEVKLTVIPLEEFAQEWLNEEQKELFETYLETKGGLQQFASPLAMDWYSQVSSYYGYRKHPITGQKQIHRGLDIAVSEGSPVYATHTGIVTTATYHSGYGNYVVITDENGFTTKYAHLSSFYVSEGQSVEQGNLIGAAGSTGNSTGSHLHLEVLQNGRYYNPIFYFAIEESIP